MHELSLCQALVDQVLQVARSQDAVAVADIYLRIGPLSGVEGPLMASAFPIAAAGTVVDGARLHLQDAPVTVACQECGTESEVPVNRLVCGNCGDWRTRLVSGDELLLERVVLDTRQPLEAQYV